MNPQDLIGFSYLDAEGHRIQVLGPIESTDTRVQVGREDGKRWGCDVEFIEYLYIRHAVECYPVLLKACEIIWEGIETGKERLGSGREAILWEAIAKARRK